MRAPTDYSRMARVPSPGFLHHAIAAVLLLARPQLAAAQNAVACEGLQVEMVAIADVCCGASMEFCGSGAPVPTQCAADTCAPVFNSFYARCKTEVRNDPNAHLYTQFIALCRNHPATGESTLLPDSPLAITEVYSQKRGTIAPSWFEMTNLQATAASTAGFVFDDETRRSNTHGTGSGLTELTIAPLESVIFLVHWEIDFDNAEDAIASFRQMWGSGAQVGAGVGVHPNSRVVVGCR